MLVLLAAAERDGGDAMRGQPIGVDASVGDGMLRLLADRSNGLIRNLYAGFGWLQQKRFVIEMAVDLDLAAHAVDIANFLCRAAEGFFELVDDPFAELRVVAACFGFQLDVIGHDVGRFTAKDIADVACPMLAVFVDVAVPTVALQVRDGECSNRDRADTRLGSAPGMAREAFDLDRHAIAARRSDRQLARRTAVEVECELRIHRPSFVFIQIGTHFESRNTEYLRKIIEQLIDEGVVPILATKADNREIDERVNRDMALLASEYDLPLWNFWAAVSDLPNRGLYTRDDRPLQGDIYLTEEAALRHRMTGLEALNAVWRVVAEK